MCSASARLQRRAASWTVRVLKTKLNPHLDHPVSMRLGRRVVFSLRIFLHGAGGTYFQRSLSADEGT